MNENYCQKMRHFGKSVITISPENKINSINSTKWFYFSYFDIIGKVNQ